MSGYQPLKIAGNQTGLVQDREEHLLPADAYPILVNAYVWRERIIRKQGSQTLGRLQRIFTSVSIGTSSDSPWTFNLFTLSSITETTAQLNPGNVVIVMGGVTFTDQGNGTLTSATPGNSGVLNYSTGAITLTTTVGSGTTATASFKYYPGLPVMGLRNRDLNSTNNQLTIAFDTVYAYIFAANGWQEFIPGTTWTGNDDEFFWHMNYWILNTQRLFWVTNGSGASGDPIRYTNGSAWFDFAPQIDSVPNYLFQCLCMLPFRGRMLVFNTWEGITQSGSSNNAVRIRWSALGSPLPSQNANAWRDDIPGQGGFIDIPVNQSIVSVGQIRDNVVIYCSRSTWQLRYTGRSIAPFQLEQVNTELGAEGTFSTVQFDTTFVGIGDKGIVECDSFKSERIDIKIPDLVFSFNDTTSGMEIQSGTERIQSVRDFVKKLAYWTYPAQQGYPYPVIYPTNRLVYNYENDSWSIFTDSITALGTFVATSGRTWANTKIPWSQCNFPWINDQKSVLEIIGGNQQGFVSYLDAQVGNDPTLSISDITGNITTPTSIYSANHNLTNDMVIQITGITGSHFTNLNNEIFSVAIVDANNFLLYIYNPSGDAFTTPQLDASGTYNGAGLIAIRDNFVIQSKKFNFADDGQSIQMGFIDLLMSATSAGAISLYVYANYNETDAVNILPQNNDPSLDGPDTFFNSVIDTSNPNPGQVVGSKYMQRIFCPVRGNYLTLVYTLSNSQMIGIEQQSNVQIDMQILWQRPAGRLTNR
jgi:hypothetical protein